MSEDRSIKNPLESKTNQEKKFFILAGIILIVYLSPLLIFGQDSHVRIHDDIAVKLVASKLLAESGKIFGHHDSVIPNMLNGVPRSSMGTEFNVMLWMIYIFGPFPAYVLNKVFIHLIALVGMYRLLIRHFDGQNTKLLALGVSLSFAVLPYFAPGELSVVAQPLALDAFLSIRRGKSCWIDWLILCLIPLYSSFYYAFIWFIIFMGLVWVYDLLSKKQKNIKFIGAIAMMSIVFLLVEYRNIYMMILNTGFASVREDFRSIGDQSFFYNIYQIMVQTFQNFFFNGSINKSLQFFLIIPAAIIGHFILFDRKLKEPILPFAVSLVFLSCFGSAIYRSSLLAPLKEQVYFVKVFYAYFIFLEPLLWFLVFYFSLKLIFNHARRGALIAFTLISLQVLYGFFYHDEIQKIRKPSYRGFYSENLFKNISEYIGKSKDSYRVVSIGLHPAVSLYNGFYTLDGYFTNYPLAHKKAFRKIIEGEIDKSEKIKSYFDNFGGRCYVFVAELGLANWLYTKDKNTTIRNLKFNTKAFMEMSGEYIISSVKIENYRENNLELLNIFEDNISAWRIYLYRPLVFSERGAILQ
jgi:hypothetical protein